METDGEGGGGGGEAERRGRSELGRLLEAIESSEVLEKRIPLIKQLEGSSRFSADDLGLILQALLASWIDSTCSGVSHCTLHRSILQVALKCSDLDITDYLGQFLTLGEKASSWCGKHLQWSVKCIDESELVQQEEHDRLRLEINSLSFSICTKLLGVAAKCFTVLVPVELEVAAEEGGQECLLNKADDEFLTLNTMAAEVEHRAVGLRTKRVQRMGPWSLAPVVSPPPQEAPRCWCTHCGPERTPRWRPGLAGPGTLCNVCAHPLKDSAAAAASWTNTLFREGRLRHSNSRCCRGRPSKKRRHSSKEVDKASALDAPRATTKGRRRVTAMETTCRQANVLAPGGLRAEKVPPVRRCTHCATEKTPKWRVGPEGPRTLCNACGVVFKRKGRLLPEYRPANSPAFSPLLHSNTHRQNETTSAACHGGAPSELTEGQLLQPANGPASSSTLQRSSFLRQSEELTSAVVGATSKASRGEARHESMGVQQLLPERPPADRPSFSLVYHRRLPECRRKSQETFAAIRATAKDRAARLMR